MDKAFKNKTPGKWGLEKRIYFCDSKLPDDVAAFYAVIISDAGFWPTNTSEKWISF